MKILLAFCALVTIIFSFSTNLPAVEVTVFGPKKFVRTTGSPNQYTEDFQQSSGPANLIILNGSESGANRVSSAEIRLNGAAIVSPRNFNQNIYSQEVPITLAETNHIEIRLSSKPGSFLTVLVT